MDMSKLFDDFKKHVESLSDEDIRQSIAMAVEHSSDCLTLDYEVDKNETYIESSIQMLRQTSSTSDFSFSSVDVVIKNTFYAISGIGGFAA